MKQKKIGTTLYVFSEDPYVITEDTDANIIYIQQEVIFDFAKINIPLISKMKPINYHPVCVKHTEWSDYYNDFTVYVEQTTGGTVTAYPTSGDEGEEIQVSHLASERYDFDHWNIVDEDGNEIEVKNGKFLMPASNVTVSAVFIQTVFSITINDVEHGTVTSNKQNASIGETVTLTINPDSGYKLDTLTVVDASSNPITVTDNHFIMPASNVTVSATFKINYNNQYLTIESQADNNTISWKSSNASYTQDIQYSTDLTNWTTVTSTTSGATLTTLNNGDKLYLKGSLTGHNFTSYYENIVSSGNFNLYGNIMSLTNGDNFINVTTLTNNYQLNSLFRTSKVTDASNLVLPATTLTVNCYIGMFYGCTSLTTAPELPATTLADYCYSNMFNGCTSLTKAPVLPATTLTVNCYVGMFKGCTSLTTAPVLPATLMYNGCYREMFKGCSSLTTAPELPATSLYVDCYRAMFSGCSSLTTAPELPATTLAPYCYYYMFENCFKLNNITMLATNISASDCLTKWVFRVATTGTFIKAASMESLPTGDSGIPTGWTVQDA